MYPYVDNLYNKLKRNGYSDVYGHAGIYGIYLDEQLVYIGKSTNMLWRLAQHYVGIKQKSERKYSILSDAKQRGHTVSLEVLYYAKSLSKQARIDEIGQKEGEYIRRYLPPLNTQIPKEDDWRRYDLNPNVAKNLSELLTYIKKQKEEQHVL